MVRRLAYVVPVVAVLAAGAILLIRGGSPDRSASAQPAGQKQPPMVRVAAASSESISSILELTGAVEPFRLAQLASPAEGPVSSLCVREGDRVRTGDNLLTIGRTLGVEAQVAALREELRKEEEDLNRTRQLVESGALPGEQLDRARAIHDRVRALLIEAEETAGDYTVKAPWNGIVSRLRVRDGDYVVPRAPLLEMYDPASLVIKAAIPERYAAQVREAMVVAVALDAHPEGPLEGRIVRIYPYLDEQTRTRAVEIALFETIDLLPGMFARLRLKLSTVEDAVVVPVEAVAEGPSRQSTVFVVEEGKAVRRTVETGIEDGQRVQIVAGLNPGAQIVVAGHEKIKDGMAVRVQEPGGERDGSARRGGERNSQAQPAEGTR